MNRIEVVCENGHRLKAARHLRGTSRCCPQCKVEVQIPLQSASASHDPLSDTGVMRILGEQDALPPPPIAAQSAAQSPQYRNCPRCDRSIPVDVSVCQHCQCYTGVMPNFLKKMWGSSHHNDVA